MSNLTNVFITVKTDKHELFVSKYLNDKLYSDALSYNEAKGTSLSDAEFAALSNEDKIQTARDTKYDNKVVFLEKTQELFTHGKLYGLNNAADVAAISTLIGTLPKRPAVGTEGEPGYEAERDYASIIEYINEMATGKASVSSKTATDITVAGGPLADDIQDVDWPWGTKDGNKYIPAGTSFEEIFTKLFLKTIDGEISITYTTWNPSIAKPTVAIKQGTTSVANKELEVGSKATVTYSEGTTVSGNKIDAKLTATQGYFAGTSATWNAAVNDYVVGTITGEQIGTAEISSATFGGTDVESGDEVTVGSGTNTLYVSQYGVNVWHNGDFENNTTYYSSTNTKSKMSDTSVTVTDRTPVTSTDSIELTSTNSASVTGVRYMFYGAVQSGDGTTSASIRSVANYDGKTSSQKNAKVAISIFATTGSKQLLIAAPKGTRGLSSILNVKASNAECVDSFVKQSNAVSVEGANGFTAADYDVWICTMDNTFEGGEEFKVTFNK